MIVHTIEQLDERDAGRRPIDRDLWASPSRRSTAADKVTHPIAVDRAPSAVFTEGGSDAPPRSPSHHVVRTPLSETLKHSRLDICQVPFVTS